MYIFNIFRSKKRKHKSDKKDKTESKPAAIVDEDCIDNGGWWKCKETAEMSGSIVIEYGEHKFIKAMDDGTFTLSERTEHGEAPPPECEFSSFIVNGNKLYIKSGFGKYLRPEDDGVITGRSDAAGSKEAFEPVFQDGKMALLCSNNKFCSVDPQDEAFVALSKTAGAKESLCVIRSSAYRGEVIAKNAPIEDKVEDVKIIELNYVKKFQKFQDKKLRLCEDDIGELKKAKESGKLHESLLDRRSKMKADRYCK